MVFWWLIIYFYQLPPRQRNCVQSIFLMSPLVPGCFTKAFTLITVLTQVQSLLCWVSELALVQLTKPSKQVSITASYLFITTLEKYLNFQGIIIDTRYPCTDKQ